MSDGHVGRASGGGADRLSQWFNWTDAISLSAALDGGAAVAAQGTHADARSAAAESARLRLALADAIEHDCSAAATERDRARSPAVVDDGAAAPPDSAPYRRRYAARQQAMQESIARLRERLREKLAGGSPELIRLAALDAVMEQVLGAQERELLAGIPATLDKHFKRLRDAAASGSDAEPALSAAATPWLHAFRRDMRAVLLAELELRFQPVEGLLDALRTK